LRERLGGDRRLDWLFIPGFFGFAYASGFYTFLLAAPIGMLVVLLAHRYAGRPTLAPGVVLFLTDLALFFSHGLVFLFANGIGGIFLLCRQPRLRRLLPALLPYAAIALVCVVYALLNLRLESASSAGLPGIGWGWDLGRLYFPVFALGSPATDTQAIPALRSAGAAHARGAAGAGCTAESARPDGRRPARGHAVRLGARARRGSGHRHVVHLPALRVVPAAVLRPRISRARFAPPASSAGSGCPCCAGPLSPSMSNVCWPSRRKVPHSMTCSRQQRRGIARSA
jgi:hypothetical protein